VTTQGEQTQRRIYRSTGSALGYFIGGLLFAGVMLFFALNTLDNGLALGIAIIGVLLGTWAALRLSRCGVYIEAEGVLVLRPMSSIRLKWSEIASFELSSYGACLIRRAHGRSVPIFGIQQTAWDAQRGTKDTDEAKQIAQLNALLESHHANRP
jgi:hypothetical protein